MALLFYYTGICIRVFEAWMLFHMPQLVVVYCCYCLKHKNPLILSRTEKRQYALYARVCDSGRISVPKKGLRSPCFVLHFCCHASWWEFC